MRLPSSLSHYDLSPSDRRKSCHHGFAFHSGVNSQFRPRAALKILEHVVRNTSFSPSVPDDAGLAAMTEDAFDKFLDAWVDKAETAAYIIGSSAADGTKTV